VQSQLGTAYLGQPQGLPVHSRSFCKFLQDINKKYF
jgi:hypothetical protein